MRANCHRLTHGGNLWLKLEDLRLSLPGYEQRDGTHLSLLNALEHGQLFWFADWPVAAVPRSGALVYTVWDRSGRFIYVGMAGRGETSAARGSGPFGRLNSHARAFPD